MLQPLIGALTALAKSGGPYLGPKGGLWADPQHTVHWEGHHGAVEVEPHASTRMYPIHLHIEDAGNGEVKISPAKGASGPTIPRESLNHLVNDLRGVVDVPKGHAHPGIAAVARGDAKMLGKGDDGVAFKHGDVVVKVSTTVPYQPFNQGHRTPKEAANMLKAQVDVGNHLADIGLRVVRSEFIRHGDKGFQIKPYVEIPPKLSREQLDDVQAALHAMHDKGYAMNDDIQAGELDGKMMFFDVGKAAPAKGEGQQSDKSRDIDRLRMLYQQNGQRFVNSRDPVGKRMWSDAEGAIRGLRQGKGSVEDVKRNVERAADARRKDAHASLSGKELAAELEDIDMDVEWANEDIDGIKGTAKGSRTKGSHVPPEAVRSAARRGLELRKKHGRGGLTTQEAGKQGIGSGVARASNLAAGDAVSTETLRRMVAFFSRHRKNKSGGEDDAGYIAWLLWGGDPGEAWAKRELAKVDRVEKGTGPLQPIIDVIEVHAPGWLELPRSYALSLGDGLLKGLSHRYIRRVPTGKTTKTGKVRYRYYYHAAHGGTVGNEDHYVVGASFKDDKGHWHITGREGDKLTLKHDETGEERAMTSGQLREHLVGLHKEAIAGAQARARQDIADARASGASPKQVARLTERAARVGSSEPSAAASKFTEGAYTSKKGNLKKVAVFTGRVDADEFKALAATAKEHGGSYIRDAGGFVFMGDAGFHAFMAAQGGGQASVVTEAQSAPPPKSEPTPAAAEPQRKAPRIAKWTAPAFGSKPSVDTAEAAKKVRVDIKAANKTGALPNGLKLSIRTDRYSMGSTLRISIEDAPFQVLNPEKLEREKSDPYTYNGLRILTPEATEIQDRLKAIANAYNRSYGDDSDGFRNTRFHVDVGYGTDVMKRDRLAFEAGAKPIASAIAPLRSQVNPEDLAPKDAAAQVSKLRATAAKVRADADSELGKDRNVNTRRRAEMASGIIERAERQSKLADAIGRAADAIEAGEAPALAAMTSKTQAQALQNIARLAHMKSMSYGEWERSGAENMHPPAEVTRHIDRIPNDDAVKTTLERMGVTSVPKLQTAVAEWIRVTDPKGAAASGAAAAKRAEIAESNLMRQGITGYFPTPKPIADKMVHAAHIEPGMTVLEPSAGSGRLADAAKAAGADVAVVERSTSLREHLKGKGYDLAGDDALSHSGKYDRVVMNPPFEGMQDVDHVRHAFDNNLKPGGRLVAIMGEGPFFREDKKAQAFREWLEASGGISEKLPSGTFDSSGTQVSSRMIVVDKPKVEARASAPVQENPVPVAATPAAQEGEQTPAKPRKFDELMQRADALNSKLGAMTPAPSTPKPTTAATNFADDIPMSLAVSAHSGTSHVPERRGEQEREGYAAHLAHVRGQLAKYETPENREAVEQAFAEYRAGYASRYKAMLSAKSRVMSSMVTGPARFPTASNQKRGDAADSRTNDVVEWSREQSKKLLKRFNPNVSGPISADRKDAVPAIESEVDKLKARQSMMVAANKVYRSKTLNDDEKVAKLVELGVSPTVARAQLKPDFAGRIGFPDYALVNNSANIRRLESRAESVATEQAKATTEHAFDGGRVVDDADANRVRIYHDAKPSADIIAKLKSSGFKWSPSEGAWQRQRNNAARYAAGVITGAAIGKGPLSPLLDALARL